MSITLVSTVPGSPIVGLGLGIPSGGIAGCTLSRSLDAQPGSSPQLTATVDPGAYCVVVYDIGRIASPIDFEITLVYP